MPKDYSKKLRNATIANTILNLIIALLGASEIEQRYSRGIVFEGDTKNTTDNIFDNSQVNGVDFGLLATSVLILGATIYNVFSGVKRISNIPTKKTPTLDQIDSMPMRNDEQVAAREEALEQRNIAEKSWDKARKSTTLSDGVAQDLPAIGVLGLITEKLIKAHQVEVGSSAKEMEMQIAMSIYFLLSVCQVVSGCKFSGVVNKSPTYGDVQAMQNRNNAQNENIDLRNDDLRTRRVEEVNINTYEGGALEADEEMHIIQLPLSNDVESDLDDENNNDSYIVPLDQASEQTQRIEERYRGDISSTIKDDTPSPSPSSASKEEKPLFVQHSMV